MNESTPAIRNLARRLLALEADRNEQAEGTAAAALSAVARLRSYLTKLIGGAGFQALLSRALALAKTEAGWLEPVRVQADATVAGFSEAARQQPPNAAAEGCAALLAQALGLLVTFVGEALTLRLVQEIWPEARINSMNLGAEEIPA